MANELESRSTQIIAVGNQKGGVSKTTTTVNLAAALGEMGRRVLILDLDSSTGATSCLGVPDIFVGSCEVMLGEASVEDAIVSGDSDEEVTLPENVHLICGRRNLEDLDNELRRRSKFADGRDSLLGPLNDLQKLGYDYVFLDTAPNTETPTTAAYKSARWFLLAAMPEPLAIEGLQDAMEDIQAVRKYGNPRLELLGVVLSNVAGRPTRLGTKLVELVNAAFPDEGGLFNTTISRAVAVPQAQAAGMTVLETAPEHKVARQYRDLAKELEQRIITRESNQVRSAHG